jgi:DNA-binding transcriptional LysR family regulator
MKQLRSFDNLTAMLATLRSGSPPHAARALRLAPSSIYRAVDRLEKEIGAPLFLRAASGWTLTEIGREIAQLAERVEEDIAHVVLSLVRHNQRFPAPLRISASDTFATFIAPIVGAFIQRERDVAVHLIVDNTMVDVARRQADLAIRPDMRPGNGLVGQRAGKLAHALYGSRSVLRLHGLPSSLDDLARHPLCSLTQDLPHFTTATWWKEIGTHALPQTMFFANTETSLAAAIAGGAGLGVLPRFVGDRLEGVTRIAAIKIADPVDIWLVTHPSLRKNRVVRSLMRTLGDAIRSEARMFLGSNA